jgi:hypothetical protein
MMDLLFDTILYVQDKLPKDDFHLGFYWWLESFGDWLAIFIYDTYDEDWLIKDEVCYFFNNLGK